MTRPTTATGLTEPPPGVLAGESIPRENTLDDQQRAAVETLANEMKARPAFADLSDSERREKARQMLDREGVL